jgi:hypothetical protein
MRFDIENQLSVAQAFTATAVSEHSYMKQTAAQDLSIGRQMSVLVIPTVAAGAGSSHVLAVIQADDAALTSNVEVLASVTVAAADLVAGAQFEIPIPKGVMDKKYIGFRDTISGGTTTVTLDAYLVPSDEIAVYKSFPKVVDAELV